MIIIQLANKHIIQRQGVITKNVTHKLNTPEEITKIQITTDIPMQSEICDIFIRTFAKDGFPATNMWKIYKETDRKEGFDNTSLKALSSLREPTLVEWEKLAKVNNKELFLYRQHSTYFIREGSPKQNDLKWDGEILHYRSDDKYIENAYLSIVSDLN